MERTRWFFSKSLVGVLAVFSGIGTEPEPLSADDCPESIACMWEPEWVCFDGEGGWLLQYCNWVDAGTGNPFDKECGWIEE